MRNLMIPAAIALVVGTSGIAFAANVATPMAKPAAVSAMAAAPLSVASTVKAFDLKTHSLTLANGATYVLPATFKDPGIKVGERVTVKYHINGKAYDAIAVTIG